MANLQQEEHIDGYVQHLEELLLKFTTEIIEGSNQHDH